MELVDTTDSNPVASAWGFESLTGHHLVEEIMRILLIDDLRDLKATRVARTFEDGIKALKEEGPWDALWLDHDLGQPDGQDGTGVMNWLDENRQFMPGCIECVSSNPVGRDRIQKVALKIYGEMNEQDNL